MHHVSKIEESAARTPKLYEPHSTGFRRATYVDRAMGSVHMGVGVCYLDPGGEIQPIQCLARCHARIAAGLFTLIVRSGSIILPPPAAACHSRALQVKASPAAPCHT